MTQRRDLTIRELGRLVGRHVETLIPISVDFSAPVIKQGDDQTEFLYFSLSLGR